MSDTVTSDAAPSDAGNALSLPQAVQLLAERRAAASTEQAESVPPESVMTPQPVAEAADSAVPSIVVDGVALTAEEVRRGYMRQADYSRKTQGLAASAKALETERNAKLTRLDELIGALESQHTQEPDWADVARRDPLGWVGKKVQWDNQRTAVESAARVASALRAETLAAEKRAMIADLAAADYPEWQDPRAAASGLRDLAHYAAAQGFSAEEFNDIAQARYLRTLDKARRWDALQQAKPLIAKRLAVKPQVQRPGAKHSVPAHQRSLGAAWETFLKSPTVENGAAYQRIKREAAAARRSFDHA